MTLKIRLRVEDNHTKKLGALHMLQKWFVDEKGATRDFLKLISISFILVTLRDRLLFWHQSASLGMLSHRHCWWGPSVLCHLWALYYDLSHIWQSSCESLAWTAVGWVLSLGDASAECGGYRGDVPDVWGLSMRKLQREVFRSRGWTFISASVGQFCWMLIWNQWPALWHGFSC